MWGLACTPEQTSGGLMLWGLARNLHPLTRASMDSVGCWRGTDADNTERHAVCQGSRLWKIGQGSSCWFLGRAHTHTHTLTLTLTLTLTHTHTLTQRHRLRLARRLIIKKKLTHTLTNTLTHTLTLPLPQGGCWSAAAAAFGSVHSRHKARRF